MLRETSGNLNLWQIWPERTAGKAELVPSFRARVSSRSTGGTQTSLGFGYTSKPSPGPVQRIWRQATRGPTSETHTVVPALQASKAVPPVWDMATKEIPTIWDDAKFGTQLKSELYDA